jgi:hypothetical protein
MSIFLLQRVPLNDAIPVYVPLLQPEERTDLMPAILFASASSKKSLQGLFPPSRIRSISCALKASIVMLLTKLICTPNPLCTPAQLRQMKMPNLGEAHCGDGAPQSQHRSFPLVFWISRSCYAVTLGFDSAQ